MMRRSAGHNGGFTLLEVTAALVIMAALVGSMYATLSLGYRNRAAAERRIKPVREVSIALSLMKEDMDAALRPTGILAGEFYGEYLMDETGMETHRLVMHTAANNPTGDSPACDARRVEFALERRGEYEDEEIVLVRRIITNLLAPVTPEPVTEVLCVGVRSFEVNYFAQGEWFESWDSVDMNNAQPRAVEVRLSILADDAIIDGEEPRLYSMSRIFPMSPAYSAGTGE